MLKERISKWMLCSHRLRIRLDWLAGCLQRIEKKQEGKLLSDDQIGNEVYSDWLLSDLRTSGLPCLPENVKSERALLIGEDDGPFTLQINEIINVGESSYSQLMKLEKKDNNLDVDCQPEIKRWQPEPKRLLLMKVTDGSAEVEAMEYQSLPFLDVTTPPGTKIRITKPFECRHGVLLLSSANTKPLGGCVPSLLNSNCPQNVLKRELGLEVTEENDRFSMEDDGFDDAAAAHLCLDAIPDNFFDDDDL
eukprot:m.145497 g.145497  ORF g.145497 m.145497 type:complete len:249 (+) comp38424_c0_seq13:27-773(+)